jgi:hypothetical protein
MKKTVFIAVLLFVFTGLVFGQTWVAEGNDHMDIEYRLITKEQWLRIKSSQENTAKGVILQYIDIVEMKEQIIISGEKPELNGYYYGLIRIIPKTTSGKEFSTYISNIVFYDNSNTGRLVIMFLNNSYVPGSLSLDTYIGREDYSKKLNQLIKIINEE